jgi:hypothetical protein
MNRSHFYCQELREIILNHSQKENLKITATGKRFKAEQIVNILARDHTQGDRQGKLLSLARRKAATRRYSWSDIVQMSAKPAPLGGTATK